MAYDLFGPTVGAGGVTLRPTDGRAPGAADSFFRDCTDDVTDDGTEYQAAFFNAMLAYLRSVARGNGNALVGGLPIVTEDNADDAILLKAIQHLIQRGQTVYAADSGVADAMVIALTPAPPEYKDGMVVHVQKFAAANATTTPTLNANGLGAKQIVRRDGSALGVGDLPASCRLSLSYAAAADKWRVMSMVSSEVMAATSIVGRTQYFFASGTFTVPAGVTQVEVEVWGGGGGGGATADGTSGSIAGNAGGGGGGGAYCRKRITGLTPGATVAVTVGAGGASVANNAGGNGGTSSFGAYCSCTGGSGGPWGVNTIAPGGLGGTASGGDINIPGGIGGSTQANSAGTPTMSHILNIFVRGGIAAGGMGSVAWGGTGSAGVGHGMGGTGASGGSGLAGGVGAPGLVIVRW
jgi:hypothetical protein